MCHSLKMRTLLGANQPVLSKGTQLGSAYTSYNINVTAGPLPGVQLEKQLWNLMYQIISNSHEESSLFDKEIQRRQSTKRLVYGNEEKQSESAGRETFSR